MIVRLAETVPWAGGYSSSVHSAWQPGETRDVSEAEAAYLVATFPDLFASADAPPAEPAPAPDAPPAEPAPAPEAPPAEPAPAPEAPPAKRKR